MSDRPLDPTHLPLQDAARLLGAEEEDLEKDLENGAPCNPDGTLDLVQYAAWLNLQLRESGDASA